MLFHFARGLASRAIGNSSAISAFHLWLAGGPGIMNRSYLSVVVARQLPVWPAKYLLHHLLLDL